MYLKKIMQTEKKIVLRCDQLVLNNTHKDDLI